MSIKYNNKVIAGKYKEQVIPFANTIDAGIAKIATQEQINEGIDNTSIVTPVYLSQKQDKLTAGEGIDIDATNTISSTILPDKITIVENDNKTISTVARKTVNESIIYDWEGTQEEYQLALLNNEINPDWYCYITDDEQAVSYGDTLSRTLSNIAPECEEVIKKLSKEAQGEEPSAGGGVGGGLPMFAHIWSDHIFNDVSYLRADNFSWHYGEIYVTAYNILEQQYNNEKSVDETENGIIFKRTPDNFKIADVSQEDSVRTLYETNGIAWYYIIDIENKRFKLPRTKYGFTGLRDKVGNDVEAGLPNITGAITQVASGTWWSQGALYFVDKIGNNTNSLSGGNYEGPKSIGLDASLSNSIYGNSDTVQPPATQQYLYFYVGAYKRPETEVDLGELINSKVDLDAENYKGSELETYINDTCINDKRTNCITEIPQRIKLELADGTLTLKAGSEVIVPNGFEEDGTTPKFDYVTIDEDVAETLGVTETYERILSYNPATKKMQVMFYGYTNAQTTASGTYFNYVTSSNIIERYSNSVKDGYNYSFPLGIVQCTDGKVSSIKKVFNGIGYIGSTFWVDKGVKALLRNGKNKDGTYKNIEFTVPKIQVKTTTATSAIGYKLVIHEDQGAGCFAGWWDARVFEQVEEPTIWSYGGALWINPETNISKYHPDDDNADWVELPSAIVGTGNRLEGGKVSISYVKQTFKALDYNDKQEIISWGLLDYENSIYKLGLPETVNGSTASFTAPCHGLVRLNAIKQTTGASMYIRVNGQIADYIGSSVSAVATPLYAWVQKGDVVTLTTDATSSTGYYNAYGQFFFPLKGAN